MTGFTRGASRSNRSRILESFTAVSTVWILFSTVDVVVICISDFPVLILLSDSAFVWLNFFLEFKGFQIFPYKRFFGI